MSYPRCLLVCLVFTALASQALVAAAIPLPPGGASSDASGGSAQDNRTYKAGSVGELSIYYDMYSIPDRMQAFQGRNLLFDTGMVSDSDEFSLTLQGTSNLVKIVMNAGGNRDLGTAWEYSISFTYPDGSECYYRWLDKVNEFQATAVASAERVAEIKQLFENAVQRYNSLRAIKFPRMRIQRNPENSDEYRCITLSDAELADLDEQVSAMIDVVGLAADAFEVLESTTFPGALAKLALIFASQHGVPVGWVDVAAKLKDFVVSHTLNADYPYTDHDTAKADFADYNASRKEYVNALKSVYRDMLKYKATAAAIKSAGKKEALSLARQIDDDFECDSGEKSMLKIYLAGIIFFYLR